MTERVQKQMTEITRNLFQMTVLIRKMMEKSVGKVSPKESFYNYLCTDAPSSQKEIWNRGVCESPSLIVFWYIFA